MLSVLRLFGIIFTTVYKNKDQIRRPPVLIGIIYAMVFCGAALMVYNIYSFIRFALFVRKQKSWKSNNLILYIPIILLVLFFLGYVAVGALGKPDLITAGILFGGSVFVFIIYQLLHNITNQIIENERLEAQLAAAEESSRVKTTFLSSMSHEMRTPLNVILGQDRIALMDPNVSDDIRDHLNKIGLSAQHLLGLINNILDMNQLESGMMTIREEEFSIREMMEQINAIVETICQEKGITYEMSCSPLVHDDCIGDSIQVKHILASILDNAVKYNEAPGSVRMEVECIHDSYDGPESDRPCTQTLQFTVSDTGIGIDSSFLPRIFDQFEKEDSSSTSRHGGSGISLAVTKQLLDLMHGSIKVESEKGKGSTFTVQIPLGYVDEKEKAKALRQKEMSKDQDDEPVCLEGRRILIVEDIPENAEIVADLLEIESVETEHAENGQIALDMFSRSEEGYYDAILMDLRMPVLDGLEATRRIRALDREDAKQVPIIALTANAYESDVQQSLGAGMDAHLAKPADADELYETIRKWIGAKSKSERRG